MNKRRFIQIFVSGSFLAYYIFKIDLSVTLKTLFSLPVSFIGISVFFYFISLWIGSAKWQVFLPDHAVFDLAKYNLVGLFYGLVLPGQLIGEGVKGFFLIKNRGETAQIFASILVDRITGFIGLLVLSIMGVLSSRQPIIGRFYWILISGAVVFFVLLFLLRSDFIYSTGVKFLSKGGKRFLKLNSLSHQIIQILDDWRSYLENPTLLFKAISLGFIYQGLSVFGTIILAVGIRIQLPFADWAWIVGVTAIVLLAPITIGGLGVREATFITLLGACGIAEEKAMALSLSLFAIQIFGALIGFVAICRLINMKNKTSKKR